VPALWPTIWEGFSEASPSGLDGGPGERLWRWCGGISWSRAGGGSGGLLLAVAVAGPLVARAAVAPPPAKEADERAVPDAV